MRQVCPNAISLATLTQLQWNFTLAIVICIIRLLAKRILEIMSHLKRRGNKVTGNKQKHGNISERSGETLRLICVFELCVRVVFEHVISNYPNDYSRMNGQI